MKGRDRRRKRLLDKPDTNQPAAIRFKYWPVTDQVLAGLGVIAEDELVDPRASCS